MLLAPHVRRCRLAGPCKALWSLPAARRQSVENVPWMALVCGAWAKPFFCRQLEIHHASFERLVVVGVSGWSGFSYMYTHCSAHSYCMEC